MHDRTNPPPVRAMAPAAKYALVVEWELARPSMPHITPSSPWASSTEDPDQAITELRGRYPSVITWFGEYTGSYWAILQVEDDAPRLIEATTPADLSRQLDSFHLRLPRRPSLSASHNDITRPKTSDPVAAVRHAPLHRASHGRDRRRSRRSMARTLSRSGRC